MENQIDLTNLQELKTKVERELFNNDPIVRNCLSFYIRGDIPYENSLLAAIIYLSEKSQQLEQSLIDLEMNRPVTLKIKGETSLKLWED